MPREMPATLTAPGSGERNKTLRRDTSYLEDVSHPLLEKYPASFLAKGGEHFVFDVEKAKVPGEMRDVVVKANKQYARYLESIGADTPEHLEELPETIREHMDDLIKKDREKFDTFRSYFGRSHVSPQRKFLMKVPMSKEAAHEVFPRKDTVPEEVWTLVTVQKRAKELGPEYAERRLDVGATYIELHPKITPKLYAEASALLFSGEPRPPGKSEKAFSSVVESYRTFQLLSLAEREHGLKEELIDFVQRAIAYSANTGEIVDFIGKNNVVFVYDTKPDGSKVWRYKITDGFFARASSERLDNAENAVSKLVTSGKMTGEGAMDFMNAANYVRTLNVMAERLGIPERLRVFHGLTKRTYEKMLSETRREYLTREEKKKAA